MNLVSAAKQRPLQPSTPLRPDLRPLVNADLPGLHGALSQVKRDDTYSSSAAYYAMTGRNGLWLYSLKDTFMVIAAHPNSVDHLLLFPPMGKEPVRLLNKAITDERINAKTTQLARMGNQDKLLLAWAQAAGHFKTGPEELLDWKFPVHTLSTNAIIERHGNRFRNFRKGIIHAQSDGLTARPIDIQNDTGVILNLAIKWANRAGMEVYSKEDLIAPTRKIIDLMQRTKLPIQGLIVQHYDRPVGFMTWEETDPKAGTANALCGMSLEGRGISEFTYLSMAQALSKRGFQYVCDGGSETAGLDAFKRKMNPVKSVSLQSAFSL